MLKKIKPRIIKNNQNNKLYLITRKSVISAKLANSSCFTPGIYKIGPFYRKLSIRWSSVIHHNVIELDVPSQTSWNRTERKISLGSLHVC